MTNNAPVYMNVQNLDAYIDNEMCQRRYLEGKEIRKIGTRIKATPKEFTQYLDKSYETGFRRLQITDNSGYVADSEDNFINFYISNGTISLAFCGDKGFTELNKKIFERDFTVVYSMIKWVHDGKGNSLETILDDRRLPVDSMYPALKGEPLKEYYDRFLTSSANVLLLIGPPGCGKTTWIRGLIHHAKTSSTVCYDPNVLSTDSIFANWLSSATSRIMVLEDADTFLDSRKDGNSMMAKFLNVGDGLVSSKGKKLVFSTNLSSVNDVDPALLRPGRCFDVLRFGTLNKEQALKLASDFGLELTIDKKSYTIADVFHQMKEREEVKFGFNV